MSLMARTTRSQRRHNRLFIHRIDELEQRIAHLEAKLEFYETRDKIRQRFPSQPAPPSPPEPAAESLSADAGARVVARHLLQAGREPDEVAAHLQEIFDLRDAASVVEEVAYYDAGLSRPTQEGT